MDWFAFGWPSRVFGGYDVEYAGVELFSDSGTILLSTLDPEEIYQKEQKHFILYGPRFKIPVRSLQYPVVLDAPGVAHLGRHILSQVEELRKAEGKQDDTSKGISECLSDF